MRLTECVRSKPVFSHPMQSRNLALTSDSLSTSLFIDLGVIANTSQVIGMHVGWNTELLNF